MGAPAGTTDLVGGAVPRWAPTRPLSRPWEARAPISPAARRQAATRSRSSSAARRSRGAQGVAAVAVRAMGLSSEVRVGGAWSTRAGGRAGGEASVAPRSERTPFIHGRSGKLEVPVPGKLRDLYVNPGSGSCGPAPGRRGSETPGAARPRLPRNSAACNIMFPPRSQRGLVSRPTRDVSVLAETSVLTNVIRIGGVKAVGEENSYSICYVCINVFWLDDFYLHLYKYTPLKYICHLRLHIRIFALFLLFCEQ